MAAGLAPKDTQYVMAFADGKCRQCCSQQMENYINGILFAKIVPTIYCIVSGMSASDEQTLQKAVLVVVAQQDVMLHILLHILYAPSTFSCMHKLMNHSIASFVEHAAKLMHAVGCRIQKYTSVCCAVTTYWAGQPVAAVLHGEDVGYSLHWTVVQPYISMIHTP